MTNDEESLGTNLPLTVGEGGTGTIDTAKLKTTDSDNTPIQLVYLVTGGLSAKKATFPLVAAIPRRRLVPNHSPDPSLPR